MAVTAFTDLKAQMSATDSMRMANKLRLDSMRSANALKRDSLASAREQAAEAKRLEREEKLLQQKTGRKKKLLPLTQEMSVGYRLCSDGWGVFVNGGFSKTEDVDQPHTNFLWIELAEKKHPKESKTLNENFAVIYPNEIKPIAYKYGKINNFYQFKIGYGNIKPITGKIDKKNVQIHWVYGAGISLGLLKPYYLDMFVPEGSGYVRTYDRYTEENKESFLDLNNQGTIIGGSYFYRGISEVKLQPGLALRSGFYFDYAPTRKSFFGVEIGASAEIYTQKIPIMVNAPNSAMFFNIYADIRYGKRWE